jgi:ferrous iron transport protein A
MNLFDVQKNETVTVKYVDGEEALKTRLFSFGITRGAQIGVVEKSLSHATIEVKVGNTMVAMRKDEAKNIAVEQVASCR